LNIFEPFSAMGKNFSEITSLLKPILPKKKETKEEPKPAKIIKKLGWAHYNIFKKAHGMLSW